MLIEISTELCSARDPRSEERFCDAMNNLLSAHRHGQHHLVMEREVVDWLLGGRLSDQSVGLLKKIRSRAANARVLLSLVREHLSVVSDDRAPNTWDGTVCHVPWTWFIAGERVATTRLLGEDVQRDVSVYRHLARAMVGRSGAMNVALSGQGGGGSQIGPNLANEASKPAIVVAVVDSDRTSPGSGLGQTAAKALEAAQSVGAFVNGESATIAGGGSRSSKAIARLVVLEDRELENIVPVALWRRALTAQDQQARINHLEVCGLLGPGSAPLLDLKEGILCRKAVGNKAEAVYLREMLTDPRRASLPHPCTSEEVCLDVKDGKNDRCSRRLMEGLGERSLAHLNNWMNSLSPEELGAQIDWPAHSELARVTRVLVEWGFASAPERT